MRTTKRVVDVKYGDIIRYNKCRYVYEGVCDRDTKCFSRMQKNDSSFGSSDPLDELGLLRLIRLGNHILVELIYEGGEGGTLCVA